MYVLITFQHSPLLCAPIRCAEQVCLWVVRIRKSSAYESLRRSSQCLVMAYVIDTPSWCLASYIILTQASIGRHLDSFLFDTLADDQPVWWSAVHEMYHPAVCDMMGGPASFLLSILDQWKAVWYAGFHQYIKHICNLSIQYQSKLPLWWSLVHWMDHPAVCNIMRGPPSVLLDISHQWKAVICRTPTAHHIYV